MSHAPLAVWRRRENQPSAKAVARKASSVGGPAHDLACSSSRSLARERSSSRPGRAAAGAQAAPVPRHGWKEAAKRRYPRAPVMRFAIAVREAATA